VESEWVNKRTDGSLPPIKCSKCSQKMIETPKSGHPNSELWINQIHPKETLLCCPNGCTRDHVHLVMRKRVIQPPPESPIMIMRRK
jgi:hypothetical protein